MFLSHVIETIGDRVLVTVDLSGPQLAAAAHAARLITQEQYRLRPLESADDVIALREITALTDELDALAAHGEICRLQLTVARLGLFVRALDDFLHSRADGVRREGDLEALPQLYAIVDGLTDAHRDAVAAALSAEPAPLA